MSMEVSVKLTLSDDMSAEAKQSLRDLLAAADTTSRANKGVGDAARAAGRAAGTAGKEGAAGAEKYVKGLRNAAAHSKAATAATREQAVAAREAARAYENSGRAASRGAALATRAAQSAARAQNELANAVRKTDGTSLSRLSRAMDSIAAKGRAMRAGFGGAVRNMGMGMAQGVGQSAYGAARANMSLRPAIDYEKRLALMANTAFAERDAAGRIAGMDQLRAAVNHATQKDVGGGTREQAAEALDAMIASGTVSAEDAMKVLPTVQKVATASGAEAVDIAKIVSSGLKQGFFTADQVPDILDMAVVAGQEGSFELKDMARWLPQLMASASGMKGIEGFRTILAAAQSSMATASDTDQAGNNLFNLFSKLTSSQFSDALKKEHNIDLTGTLAAAREKGQLPLESVMVLLNQEVFGKDKRFQALQAKAAKSEGPEKEKVFADMADLIMASAIGSLLPDKQAGMALAALLGDPDYFKKVFEATGKAQGAADTSFTVAQSTVSASADAANNALAEAQQKALDKLSPALNLLADGVTKAAEIFPTVTTAAATAAAALGSIAAVAGASMLMRRRGGARKPGGGDSRAGKTRAYRNAPEKNAAPAHPAAPAKNAGEAGQAKAAKTAETAKPGGEAKTTETAKSTGEAKAADTAKPGGAAKKSVGEIEGTGTAKPGGETKAAAPAKTVKPGTSAPKQAMKGGTAGTAFFAVADAAMTESNDTLSREEKNRAHLTNAGGTLGAVAIGAAGTAVGAKGGAIAGTVFGPIGIAVGSLIGAIAGMIGSVGGYYLGSWVGEKAGDIYYSAPEAHPRGSAGRDDAALYLDPTYTGQGGALPPLPPKAAPRADASPSPGPARPAGHSRDTAAALRIDDSLFPGMAYSPGDLGAPAPAPAPPPAAPLPTIQVAAPPAPAVTNHIRVVIDGREVFAAMEERLERLSNRG